MAVSDVALVPAPGDEEELPTPLKRAWQLCWQQPWAWPVFLLAVGGWLLARYALLRLRRLYWQRYGSVPSLELQPPPSVPSERSKAQYRQGRRMATPATAPRPLQSMWARLNDDAASCCDTDDEFSVVSAAYSAAEASGWPAAGRSSTVMELRHLSARGLHECGGVALTTAQEAGAARADPPDSPAESDGSGQSAQSIDPGERLSLVGVERL